MPGYWQHQLIRLLVRAGEARFRRSEGQLEAIQRPRLGAILQHVASATHGPGRGVNPRWSWAEFASAVPVTRYDDWADAIDQQMATQRATLSGSPMMRYQPTSGSSSAIKWIPYTQQFLRELDAAISPWMSDLYRRYPGVRQGRHYWSLSWLPTDMRDRAQGQLNDDMKLLSSGKRLLVSGTQAVPESVALATTSDDSLFATLAYLASQRDLSALSVWSPTFALGLLQKLAQWRDELVQVLRFGRWGAREQALGHMPAPRSVLAADLLKSWSGQWDGPDAPLFYQAFWPQLALVSAWDTATATRWARQLRSLLPHAAFQGKGLWATEGVVSFPYGDDSVLAASSHFYEFEDVASGQIIPAWRLEKGQQVVPLLTTGSGLLRYRLGDQVEVSGFRGQLPCLTFLGRDGSTDMVGEKLSTAAVQQALNQLPWPPGVSPVVVLAVERASAAGRPGYVLLAQAVSDASQLQLARWSEGLADALEVLLTEHFHYRLARNLGQLAKVACLCRPNAYQYYLGACRSRGMIDGNLKTEALRHWSGALPGTPAAQLRPSQAMEVPL